MIREIDCRGKKEKELIKAVMKSVRGAHDESAEELAKIEDAVFEIISDVRRRGDVAVLEYTMKFDGGNGTGRVFDAVYSGMEVTEAEMTEAYERLFAENPSLIETIKLAAKRIEEYHKNQEIKSFQIEEKGGTRIGQRVLPVERAGIYVPGGTAAYPSTVLMSAIPAKIAGVEEIIMVSPPDEAGHLSDAVLVAAKIAGVHRIFKIGGAQAVAALAYGTDTVPRVDKIVGPGNIYVATAKKLVFGNVDIDMIAGPSEILIIADGTANPAFAAADMLSQAEHDKMASAILITDSAEFAKQVSRELQIQLGKLPRTDIATASIENKGRIILVDDLKAATEIANELAPEHLEIMCAAPFEIMDEIKNAGSIFLGEYTPEALGDYIAGPNHTLPTSGTARFSSPLSVYDFLKRSSYIYFSKDSLFDVGESVMEFAASEGLDAHGNAVAIRIGERNE